MPASEVSEWLKSIHLDDEESEEFEEAAELFEKHKINRFDRLLTLNDAQWGRLGLPLGVEASIRDALAQQFPDAEEESAPPVAAQNLGNFGNSRQPTAQESAQQRRENQNLSNSNNFQQGSFQQQNFGDFGQFGQDAHGDPDEFGAFDDDESEDGLGGFQDSVLRRRGTARQNKSKNDEDESKEWKPLINVEDNILNLRNMNTKMTKVPLDPPEDLEQLWEQLLDDCTIKFHSKRLPPDKRMYINQTWKKCVDNQEKYMMFLEYSSYLRTKNQTQEEQQEHERSLGPLLNQYMGLGEKKGGLLGNPRVWRSFQIGGVVLVIAALYYGSVWLEGEGF